MRKVKNYLFVDTYNLPKLSQEDITHLRIQVSHGGVALGDDHVWMLLFSWSQRALVMEEAAW